VPVLRLAHDHAAAAPVPDLLVEQVDEAGDDVVIAVHREEQRHDAPASGEDPLADGDGLVEVGPLLVEVRHDNGPGHADELAFVPQPGRRCVDPVDRRHDEQGGVGAS
jgi:hypothetical protein